MNKIAFVMNLGLIIYGLNASASSDAKQSVPFQNENPSAPITYPEAEAESGHDVDSNSNLNNVNNPPIGRDDD